jgi:acyl-CoA thioesterase-1
VLLRRPLVALVLIFLPACAVRDAACGKPVPEHVTVVPEAAPDPADPSGGAPAVGIAFLGDSLTTGFGLLSQRSFPSQIGEMFEAEGYDGVEVINAGLTGDTSAGGLRRAQQVLDLKPKILVIALGANDALRGLTVANTRDNLQQIITLALSQGARVMLCGMEAPTNYGEDYRTSFRQLYFELLRNNQRQIVYIPFLLEGVAGNPAMNQSDGIHPNEAGARAVAELLYPKLRSMVDGLGG